MEESEDEDGVKYISCDVLCVGDYGGASSVGEANIRALGEDYPDSITRHWPYSTRQLFLPDTPETREIIEHLERDYPLYNEEEHSKVEMEWEQEAWESWLRSDLVRTLEDRLKEWAEDTATGDQLWEAYRWAMEKENEYPIMENNGCCVRTDEIQESFARAVLCRFLGAEDDIPDEILHDLEEERGLLEEAE
jgi:hypothetical protein